MGADTLRTAKTGRTATTLRVASASRGSIAPDVSAPSIAGLSASGVTSTAATISFATDEPATSQLQYDDNALFSSPATVTVESVLSLVHDLRLTGLTADTTYYFRANATDAAGNASGYTSNSNFVTTGGGAAWVDSGTLTNVTLGQMTLDATFESIAIEALFSESVANTITGATAEFRTSPDGTVIDTLPLHIVRPASGSAAALGKCLLLTHNTAYDVRVTFTSGANTATKAGSVTTRNDNLPSAASLTVTHYLSQTGSDTTGDGSSGAPWQTITKAVTSAPAGSVIRMAPGWYARYNGTITKSLSFIAQNPAVSVSGSTRSITTTSGHAIVYSGAMTGPSGATENHLKGTAGSAWSVYDAGNAIYKLPAATHGLGAGLTQMSVGSTALGQMLRVPFWKRSGDAATLAQWVTTMTTNLNTNFGFWMDSNGDAYVKLQSSAPSTNPNNLYVSLSGGNFDKFGFVFGAANCRLSGLHGVGMDALVQLTAGASFAHIDHNLHYGGHYGVRVVATSPGTYGSDHVIEDNIFIDDGLWNASPTKDNTIAWSFIKGTIVKSDGSVGNPNRIGEASESTGITLKGGARRLVARRNTIDGFFNGISANASGYDRYASYANDWHDNLVKHLSDDAFEPEQAAANLAIWNNTTQHTKTVLSMSPVWFGPVYLFHNSCWMTGAHGTPVPPPGTGNVPGGGNILKYTGPSMASTMAVSKLYMLNNTIWTNAVTGGGLGTKGFGNAGGTSNLPYITMRNNILRVSSRVIEWESAPQLSKIDEDYNLLVTSGASPNGIKWGGTEYRTIAGWRNAYASSTSRTNTHTNKLNSADVEISDSATVDALLTDTTTGDLTLKAGTNYAVDAGVIAANVARTYSDTAPDLGYQERG